MSKKEPTLKKRIDDILKHILLSVTEGNKELTKKVKAKLEAYQSCEYCGAKSDTYVVWYEYHGSKKKVSNITALCDQCDKSESHDIDEYDDWYNGKDKKKSIKSISCKTLKEA